MKFGIHPETITDPNAVYSYMDGQTADSMLACSSTMKKVCAAAAAGSMNKQHGSQNSMIKEGAAQQTLAQQTLAQVPTNSFTDSARATVESLREHGGMCVFGTCCIAPNSPNLTHFHPTTGQRVSFNDWARWMDRSYGTRMELPVACPENGVGTHCFNQPGRVCIAVATFADAKHLEEQGLGVETMWERMWNSLVPPKHAQEAAKKVAPAAEKAAREAAARVREARDRLVPAAAKILKHGKQHGLPAAAAEQAKKLIDGARHGARRVREILLGTLHEQVLNPKELAALQHVEQVLDAFGDDAFEAYTARTLNTIILGVRLRDGVKGSFPKVVAAAAAVHTH